jgi:hypothetical protein
MGSLPSPTPEPDTEAYNDHQHHHHLLPSKAKDTSIIHVVHFRFYDSVPAHVRSHISHAFTLLQDKCLHPKTHRPYIKAFTGGVDVSIENLQRGYHASFILEFESAEDRDFYVLKDEAHRGFGTRELTGLVEEVMVMDFQRGRF